MSLRRGVPPAVPETPRVASPGPSPSGHRAGRAVTPPGMPPSEQQEQPLEDRVDDGNGPRPRRSRTRSRSPVGSQTAARVRDKTPRPSGEPVAAENGHLAPPRPGGWSSYSWRDLGRSPSPPGLIPVHRHWRTLVHRHEVPRKALHVSIGFFVVWLYLTGTRTEAVPPYLMGALIPIAATDLLRHRFASVNRLYVRLLGALMRESECSAYNGVVFYLVGAWAVLCFLPKDVAAVSVLLLSWCDTAASTFGRLWGRYTPRVRRGKSLAGSLAAFFVGVATSVFWYGWLVPTYGPMPGDEDFMFTGTLSLPSTVAHALGLSRGGATLTGMLALGVLSVWNGFAAAASEVLDVFGCDDNLTIPVLSGIGIWGFLKVFG